MDTAKDVVRISDGDVFINNLQLTMSHTGLGNLNEYALMVLFGNVHSFRLTAGLDITPSEIAAVDGTVLYPAYFRTRVKVPLHRLLPTFKLWDSVDVGIVSRKFGDTLLESEYILADQGVLYEDKAEWNENDFPIMQGNNLLVAEELNSSTAKRKVLNPDPKKISSLPRAKFSPKEIAHSRTVRLGGIGQLIDVPHFRSYEPFTYRVLHGRDCTHGHAMIFAKFCEIFDLAERDYLSSKLLPAFSNLLLDSLQIVERDIYYYGNCYAGEDVDVYLSGKFDIQESDEFVGELDYIPAAFLNICFEIYQKNTRTLLAISQAKKVFAIPMQEQENINDLRRLIENIKCQHASNEE